MEYLKTCGPKLLQWHLRDFPLRNGKGAFYDRFQKRLAPAERYVIAELPGFRMKIDLHDPSHRKTFFYGAYVPAFLYRRKWYQSDDVRQVRTNIFWFKPSLARRWEKAARIPGRMPS